MSATATSRPATSAGAESWSSTGTGEGCVITRWRRPSPEGRRVALDRKLRLNCRAHGRATKLVTLTPPGKDLLPWTEGKVEWPYNVVWNTTAGRRLSRLFEAAQRSADRAVRAQGWTGELPRQVANAWGWQKRGLKHWHWLLPNETAIEVAWTQHVVWFLDACWRAEQARWTPAERWALLWAEYRGEATPKGFYGFGFVDRRGGARRGGNAGPAGYLARNAAGYVAGQGGGHYVSRELTRRTGVTMRALRACNWLYVRRKMIQAGELEQASWVPHHWAPEWRDHVLGVWALLGAPQAP